MKRLLSMLLLLLCTGEVRSQTINITYDCISGGILYPVTATLNFIYTPANGTNYYQGVATGSGIMSCYNETVLDIRVWSNGGGWFVQVKPQPISSWYTIATSGFASTPNPLCTCAPIGGFSLSGSTTTNFTLTGTGTQTVLVLPIILTALSAQKTTTGTQVTWQTATETNNKGFDIEKSTDGISFTKIGFVSGSNNSSTIKNYNYTDNSLCTGKQFYRLKQIDNNDNFKYSDIATVLCQNNAKVVITPNPVSSTVTIVADNLVQLKLISSSGQIISNLKASVSNTNNMDVSKLPAGMYLVNMFFKDGSYTTQNLQVRH